MQEKVCSHLTSQKCPEGENFLIWFWKWTKWEKLGCWYQKYNPPPPLGYSGPALNASSSGSIWCFTGVHWSLPQWSSVWRLKCKAKMYTSGIGVGTWPKQMRTTLRQRTGRGKPIHRRNRVYSNQHSDILFSRAVPDFLYLNTGIKCCQCFLLWINKTRHDWMHSGVMWPSNRQ